MTKINWNLPLVADVGKPLKVDDPDKDGHRRVVHDGAYELWHAEDGCPVHCLSGIRRKYNLRNRPWRVGDPVVSIYSGMRGVVDRISSYPGDAFPILVLFDDGDKSWMTADGIRYDYSRFSEPGQKTEQGESYKPWSHYGYDPETRDPHAELEALIADAMEAHDAGRNHNATPDPDGPFTIRCNVSAIEMFAEECAKAIAKARAEALEEAAATIDGLRPAVGWSEQTADDWGCGCLDAARGSAISPTRIEPMTDRISEDRLQQIAQDYVSAMTVGWPEVQSMALELKEYRERLAKIIRIAGLDGIDR